MLAKRRIGVVVSPMITSLAAWLIAAAVGSAAARGLFELGAASYWGVLVAAGQGLVLRRRGVPYMRWLAWSAAGWVVGAVLVTRLIAALVSAVADRVPGLSAMPPGLEGTVAVFAIFGAAGWMVLRPHMPNAFIWVALSALAGAVLAYIESPLRVLLFAPVEAAAGVSAAEALVGAALGAVYGAITAPQILRIGPASRASRGRDGPDESSLASERLAPVERGG